MAGRPLSNLSEDGGPLVALAQDLRQLRARAGDPTLESMSRRSGLSRTVLSEAMSGKKLPSETVLEGFVRQCDGTDADVAAWLERRQQVLTRLESDEADDAPAYRDEIDAAPPKRRPPWVAIALGATAIALAAVAAVVGFQIGNQSDAGPDVTLPRTGQDPVTANCRQDAVIGARVGQPDGSVLELVYSEKCGANWGRLIRTDNKVKGNSLSVTLTGKFDKAPNPLTATTTDQQIAYTPILLTGPDDKVCVTGTVTTDGVAYDLPQPACG